MKRFFFIIGFFILFGCGSRKAVVRNAEVAQTVTATSADTLIHEIRETTAQFVPEARATVSASVEDIKNLPEAAVITARNGRASVTIRYLSDTVTVTAVCDSLQRQVANYELREKSYANIIESQEKRIKTFEKKERENGIFSSLKYLLTGIVAGAVITLAFTKKSLISSVIDFIKNLFKK
jgi:hypothetical protein